MVIGDINCNCTVLFHPKQNTSSLHPKSSKVHSQTIIISPEKNEDQRKWKQVLVYEEFKLFNSVIYTLVAGIIDTTQID